MATEKKWALALHGGAGGIPRDEPVENVRRYRAMLSSALALGQAMLETGDLALNVVEAVVVKLENDPLFNAGRGAVLTADGGIEMDAAIMDGRTLGCGAVAAVTTVRNPVSLARLVMERTPHVLLAGEGAERFAREMSLECAPPEYFRTEKRVEQWRRARERQTVVRDHDSPGTPGIPGMVDAPDAPDQGTVGCVALDMRGNLAAATSTGGMTNKMPGRVGDTPLIGAGTYADNRSCAVSCTGTGEQFMRHVAAFSVASLIEHAKLTLDEATETVIRRRMKVGDGGLIAVDREGRIAMPYSSAGMFRAAADWTGRAEVAIWET